MKPVNKTKSTSSKLSYLLNEFRPPKGENQGKMTNTRIGSQEMEIYGGKFNIPNERYFEFLNTYYQDVFVKGMPEYLTEAQLEKGPILVDVDLRHEFSVTTRQYTPDHISDLVYLYLGIIKKSFQLDDSAVIPVYVFQKPAVNRVEALNITKDGVHLIFGISCDHTSQVLIRKKVIAEIGNVWGEELNITNTWDQVFDEGISQGHTNWQLIGSRKPGNEAYRLTGIYTATFDASDQEFSTIHADASTFNMEKDIYKLSARYPDHYEPFMTSSFMNEYNKMKGVQGNKPARSNVGGANTMILDVPEIHPLAIKTREQLDACLKGYVDNIAPDHYSEYEAYAYTMTLPEKYYQHGGSYDYWFRVGCALRNISNSLFIVFLAFSAQSTGFQFNQITDLWDQWQKFDLKNKNGLQLRSIMYWSHKDAPEKYKEVRENSLDYYIERTLDSGLAEYSVSDKKSQGATDYDIARVLYHLKKDQFICTSIASNLWYQFRNHRWVEIDSGTSLRMAISTELRSLYGKKAEQINDALSKFEDPDDPKCKALTARLQKVIDIYARLGRTNDKKNLMQEARDMFYDADFMNTVDTNPYLLCCSNGVWDLKEKVFRDGKPEDYISMSTNLEYKPLTEKDQKTKAEIIDFMNKLFPIVELREYMWDHLASTLLGTAVNQTFNNYIGGGRNGKSVLVTLMTKTLGEYKGELPLTAVVTQKRVGVGGLAPEITALKGKRYAVMQEPRQGDVLNEGILKELTSGFDSIQARAPYQRAAVTFIPQFKLVVCANVLPEIKAQDHGTWRRIRVIPFMSLFTENPVDNDPHKPYQYLIDSTIDEKFDTWKSVFLAMLVERVLVTNGKVVDCETVLKASNDYKHKQDVISQFIEEKIVRAPGEKVKKAAINNEFKIWHESNFGIKGPQSKEVHVYLDKLFGEHDQQGWRDIKMIYDTSNRDEEINPDEISDTL
jgi:P4 family phage/plasmid primase-like protien